MKTKRHIAWLWAAMVLISGSGCIDLVTEGAKDAVSSVSESVVEALIEGILESTIGDVLP